MKQFYVGTSGYGYKEWKGAFYPEKLPQKEMLGYYAERFTSVEMNNTFRRMPTSSSLTALAEQVPAGFRFAVKAPQAITHFKRLKDADNEVKQLVQAMAALKKRQGPMLFQLPPNFKQDLPRLRAFLRLVPKKVKAAFEFRHNSWFDDEVYDCLRKRGCVLCIADTDDGPHAKPIDTAGWGYVRMRREKYTDKALENWLKQFAALGWKEAYIFFKHEETGSGPKFAARWLKLSGSTQT